MTPPSTEQVKIHAERFRYACEEVARTLKEDDWLGHFGRFPEGCCSDTAYLMAESLVRRFAIEPDQLEIALNAWRDGASHAWLIWDGWIIDITAGQFPDCGQPIIFTRSSAWHRTWTQPEHALYQSMDPSDAGCDARWLELLRQIEESMAV